MTDSLQAIQRNFLWVGTERNNKYPLVAWETICRPKKKDGLGIKNLKQFNKALQAKQIWRIFNSIGEWREILKDKYASNMTFKQFISRDNDPRGWNGILRTKGIATEKVRWKLGNVKDVNFWHDD